MKFAKRQQGIIEWCERTAVHSLPIVSSESTKYWGTGLNLVIHTNALSHKCLVGSGDKLKGCNCLLNWSSNTTHNHNHCFVYHLGVSYYIYRTVANSEIRWHIRSHKLSAWLGANILTSLWNLPVNIAETPTKFQTKSKVRKDDLASSRLCESLL